MSKANIDPANLFFGVDAPPVVWADAISDTETSNQGNRWVTGGSKIKIAVYVCTNSTTMQWASANLGLLAKNGLLVHVDSELYGKWKKINKFQARNVVPNFRAHNAKMGFNWQNPILQQFAYLSDNQARSGKFVPSITPHYKGSDYLSFLKQAEKRWQADPGLSAHFKGQQGRFTIVSAESLNRGDAINPEGMSVEFTGEVKGTNHLVPSQQMFNELIKQAMVNYTVSNPQSSNQDLQSMAKQLASLEQELEEAREYNDDMHRKMASSVMVKPEDFKQAMLTLPHIMHEIAETTALTHEDHYLLSLIDANHVDAGGCRVPTMSGERTCTASDYQNIELTVNDSGFAILNFNAIRCGPMVAYSPSVESGAVLNSFASAPALSQSLEVENGDDKIDGFQRYLAAYETGITFDQYKDSHKGRGITWLDDFTKLRLVSAKFTLHKTSKSQTEAGTVRIHYGPQGIATDSSIREAVDIDPNGSRNMKSYVSSETGPNGVIGCIRYQPVNLMEQLEMTGVQRIMLGEDTQYYIVNKNKTNPSLPETNGIDSISQFAGPVRCYAKTILDGVADPVYKDDVNVSEPGAFNDQEVVISAIDLSRNHTAIIMFDGVPAGTTFSLNLRRHFEGIPSNRSSRSVEQSILSLKYSNPMDIIRKSEMPTRSIRGDFEQYYMMNRGIMDWPLVGDVARILKYGGQVLTGKRSVSSALLDGVPAAIQFVTSKIPGLNFLSGTIGDGLRDVAQDIRQKHNIKGIKIESEIPDDHQRPFGGVGALDINLQKQTNLSPDHLESQMESNTKVSQVKNTRGSRNVKANAREILINCLQDYLAVQNHPLYTQANPVQQLPKLTFQRSELGCRSNMIIAWHVRRFILLDKYISDEFIKEWFDNHVLKTGNQTSSDKLWVVFSQYDKFDDINSQPTNTDYTIQDAVFPSFRMDTVRFLEKITSIVEAHFPDNAPVMSHLRQSLKHTSDVLVSRSTGNPIQLAQPPIVKPDITSPQLLDQIIINAMNHYPSGVVNRPQLVYSEVVKNSVQQIPVDLLLSMNFYNVSKCYIDIETEELEANRTIVTLNWLMKPELQLPKKQQAQIMADLLGLAVNKKHFPLFTEFHTYIHGVASNSSEENDIYQLNEEETQAWLQFNNEMEQRESLNESQNAQNGSLIDQSVAVITDESQYDTAQSESSSLKPLSNSHEVNQSIYVKDKTIKKALFDQMLRTPFD